LSMNLLPPDLSPLEFKAGLPQKETNLSLRRETAGSKGNTGTLQASQFF
jgi:hypothetical protein